MSDDVARPPRGGQDPPARRLRLVHPSPSKGPPKRSVPLFAPEEARRVRAALKTARFMFGTWACLADAMGVRGNRAQRIACGVRPVSGEIAMRLARALGIPLEALLRGLTSVPKACPTCGRGPT